MQYPPHKPQLSSASHRLSLTASAEGLGKRAVACTLGTVIPDGRGEGREGRRERGREGGRERKEHELEVEFLIPEVS